MTQATDASNFPKRCLMWEPSMLLWKQNNSSLFCSMKNCYLLESLIKKIQIKDANWWISISNLIGNLDKEISLTAWKGFCAKSRKMVNELLPLSNEKYVNRAFTYENKLKHLKMKEPKTCLKLGKLGNLVNNIGIILIESDI